MTPPLKARLSPEQIAPLASRYLAEGRLLDRWRIDGIDVEGPRLQARVSMTSWGDSGTDADGFHLTIFSTLEFASQLMIVYAHLWAGLDAKRREGWMVESTARAVKAIRRREGIAVQMDVRQIRRRGVNLYCVADFVVTDGDGGHFEISLKGFLS